MGITKKLQNIGYNSYDIKEEIEYRKISDTELRENGIKEKYKDENLSNFDTNKLKKIYNEMAAEEADKQYEEYLKNNQDNDEHTL